MMLVLCDGYTEIIAGVHLEDRAKGGMLRSKRPDEVATLITMPAGLRPLQDIDGRDWTVHG